MTYATPTPKSEYVGFRADPGEVLALERYAAARKAQSRSDAIRMLIREYGTQTPTTGRPRKGQPQAQG